jgi:hypothetical protein
MGPEVWGDYTRSDDIIPQEMIAELAKKMEMINTPPPPPGGESKYRRDSLPRCACFQAEVPCCIT